MYGADLGDLALVDVNIYAGGAADIFLTNLGYYWGVNNPCQL